MLDETGATMAGQMLPENSVVSAVDPMPAQQGFVRSAPDQAHASTSHVKNGSDSDLPQGVPQSIGITGERSSEANDVHQIPGPELKSADELGKSSRPAAATERAQQVVTAQSEVLPRSSRYVMKAVPARAGDGPPLTVMADIVSRSRDVGLSAAHRAEAAANPAGVVRVRSRETASSGIAAPATQMTREAIDVRQEIPQPCAPAGAGQVQPAGDTSRQAAPAGGLIRHDVIAALDRDAGNAPVHWIHATPQRAEAGFHDPSLGWVSVRAQADGSSVHASIVPTSSEAAQVLSSHLATLNTHLAESQTNVRTVTMSAQERAWSSGGFGEGMPGGQQQHHGERRESAQTSESNARAGGLSAIFSPARKESLTASRSASSTKAGSIGFHISVVA